MSNNEELKVLIKKRGSIKGRLTIFKKYVVGVTELLSNSENNLTKTEICALQLKKHDAEDLLVKFRDVQEEIEIIVEETELETELNERQNFESVYYDSIAAVNIILSAFEKTIISVDQVNDAESVASSAHGAPSLGGPVNLQSIKLPTIALPKFDGGYETWLEFRDTFSSLIHGNINITDIQKFHYLKACLHGVASNLLQSFELSASNYEIAWQTLCDRYNNTNLLLQNHIKALFNLEAIGRESSNKLRKLIDTVSKHLRSLKALGQPTEQWDILVIYMITSKLDRNTEQEWEKYKGDNSVPTLQHLQTFLKNTADVLETIELSHPEKVKIKQNFRETERCGSKSLLSLNNNCAHCNKGGHQIYVCEEFQKLSISDRQEKTRQLKLCLNCLRSGHFSKSCKFGHCKKCKRKHNTLLHSETEAVQEISETVAAGNATLAAYNKQGRHVLLATVCLRAFDSNNKPHMIRAVLDSGSQSNIMSISCYKKLKLNREDTNVSVVGINGSVSKTNSKCSVSVKSIHGSFGLRMDCVIMSEIPGHYPNLKFNISQLNDLRDLQLADPSFNIPEKVDLLIGSELFWDIICPEQRKLGANMPILQRTKFGWVLAGAALGPSKQIHCNLGRSDYNESTDFSNIQKQLTTFWEIEEVSKNKIWSLQETDCETHFQKHAKRDATGRFVVSIPLKDSLNKLGESKEVALKRFYSLERKLKGNELLNNRYKAFMAEYEQLGHMSKVAKEKAGEMVYYMPHHGVMREDSESTKLRVVFDGSAPSSTGISINDLQAVGPVIQNDLFSIVVRFRKHSYVMSADIQKMYRQVLVEDKYRDLQRILWRSEPTESITAYKLNTVTYGTASASFLAIRSLHQLAIDCEKTLPLISKTIKNDFYVDDLITGAETIEAATEICAGITEVLRQGCFELKKWTSNEPHILNAIPHTDWSSSILKFGTNSSTKTLGLTWSCDSDVLIYKINIQRVCKRETKRTILSTISQIFDPLGLLGPCIIMAKVLLQELWLEKLSWDQPLPTQINSSWCKLREELQEINSLSVQRHVICKNPMSIELHGFSDASERAYGACIYIRSIDKQGNVFVHLLCAKSKVAPLKSLTIPRLELCGALILARLYDKVLSSLEVNFNNCTLWCDSTIVIAWIHTTPNLLQTFVGNRVSEVIELTKSVNWRHVPTKENPADMLSRGMNPAEIKNCSLWWHGPAWLKSDQSLWPVLQTNILKLPELRKDSHVSLLSTNSNEYFPIHNYSNLPKLVRIVAYIRRFTYNCIAKYKDKPKLTNYALSLEELNQSLIQLVKVSQMESFGNNFHVFQKQFAKLAPFMDNDRLIRVGGRLENSNLSQSRIHPLILPSNHHLTRLVFKREHLRLLHAGPQLLLASIRGRFWPLSGRNLARKTVHECLTCFKANPKGENPIMGNLPKHRVQPTHPFNITGVDYAGPLLLKDKKGRGGRKLKCYVSLFVCFSTKAIHLELVTELTSSAFIMAMRRFVSRRGIPSHMYSDNGTNFVGANSELKELGKFLSRNKEGITDSLASYDISWHFSPPYTPHFGGLWEAGVRSVKNHLKRVAGNSSLTFEEMYTLLVQIEAVLNSRPISPLSSDVQDPNPLTPAHFLIGRPLTSLPDTNIMEVPEHRLSRFQRIQQLQQHFWVRWRKEYLTELQHRSKWTKKEKPIKEGDLVLIKENNLPPMKWCLGRVIEVFPGSDNVTRVVSLKTKTGIVKRGVSKLCPLPLQTAVAVDKK